MIFWINATTTIQITAGHNRKEHKYRNRLIISPIRLQIPDDSAARRMTEIQRQTEPIGGLNEIVIEDMTQNRLFTGGNGNRKEIQEQLDKHIVPLP